MEPLLDQADALVRVGGGEPPRPDLTVPDEYSGLTDITDTTASNNIMVLQEHGEKGRGWYACSDIAAGTILLVSKPIAMVMDWQDDSFQNGEDDDDDEDPEEAIEDDDEGGGDDDRMDEEEKEPRLNELLLLEILDKLKDRPDLWTDQLQNLYPRDNVDLSMLPAWVCHNDDVFLHVESSLARLDGDVLPVKEISKRLPLIIRYNILSIETCAELLSYPGTDGHSTLAGVGLYHGPSFFNHSASPNVTRWAIGDIMVLVTNQDVETGQELCISYIEHDVLCEPAWRRNLMMNMDFEETDGNSINDNDDNNAVDTSTGAAAVQQQQRDVGPTMPVVDSDVQNELMSMDPFERLTAIEELLSQALGEKAAEDYEEEEEEEGMETSESEPIVPWFQCDVQNIRILKAITLDGLGQTQEALGCWEEAIQFVQNKLPPNDESGIVLRVQAALCAWHMGDTARAQQHADLALQTHRILFGGGVARFRRRLRRDLELPLRPTKQPEDATACPQDALWPLPPIVD